MPCENCTKRGCSEICPDGVRDRTTVRLDSLEPKADVTINNRVAALEAFIQRHIGSLPETEASSASSDSQRAGNRLPVEADTAPFSGCLTVGMSHPEHSRTSGTGSTSCNPSGTNVWRTKDQAGSSGYSAREPSATRTTLRNDPPAEGTSGQGIAGDQMDDAWLFPEAEGTSHAAPPNLANAPHETQHNREPGDGTLAISHTGRSKYVGPTAGSEWLLDVGLVNVFGMYTTTV